MGLLLEKKIDFSLCKVSGQIYIEVQSLVREALQSLEAKAQASCDLHVEDGIELEVV